LIELIGVIDAEVEKQVASIISGAQHKPEVAIKAAWYY